MVYSEERQPISGERGRIQSETQDPTKDDLNHQEKLTFSQGCGVHNCDCKCNLFNPKPAK